MQLILSHKLVYSCHKLVTPDTSTNKAAAQQQPRIHISPFPSHIDNPQTHFFGILYASSTVLSRTNPFLVSLADARQLSVHAIVGYESR